MSQIINLYGGPGTGKSTTAALMFGYLKQEGYNAELVREYVKNRAWENLPIGPFDQFYFFGKQARYESLLYGKVDVIVTDSPVALSAYYARKFCDKGVADALYQAAEAFYKLAERHGHHHHHVFLERTKGYNPKGRYQTEDEAKAMDSEITDFITWFVHQLRIPVKYPVACGTNEEDIRNYLHQLINAGL